MLSKNGTPFPYTPDDLKTRFSYDGDGNIEYIGKAKPGTATSVALWQIRKYTTDAGAVTAIDFPDGNNDYAYVWDNRATYDYS